jgi:hypothetical protein
MAATATTPPPVVGRDIQRWQRVPQLLAEVDGGNPKCILARTATAMVTAAPPVVGRVGGRQRWLPSRWQWLPQLLAESFAETDESGDISPSCRQWLQQSSAESDKSGNVNDRSPSCWRRQTAAATGPQVVGGDGQRRQQQQSLPQLSVETDNGGNESPSCWRRWMVATLNAYWHAPQWQW